jgi:hypothetical protein
MNKSKEETLSLKIPVQLKADLKIVAVYHDLSIKEYTAQALEEKLLRDPAYHKVQQHRYEDTTRANLLKKRLLNKIEEVEKLPKSYSTEKALLEFGEALKDPVLYYERKILVAQEYSLEAFKKDEQEDLSL